LLLSVFGSYGQKGRQKGQKKVVQKRQKVIKTEEKPAMSMIELIFGIYRFLSEAAFALRDLVNQHSSGCQKRSRHSQKEVPTWKRGHLSGYFNVEANRQKRQGLRSGMAESGDLAGSGEKVEFREWGAAVWETGAGKRRSEIWQDLGNGSWGIGDRRRRRSGSGNRGREVETWSDLAGSGKKGEI